MSTRTSQQHETRPSRLAPGGLGGVGGGGVDCCRAPAPAAHALEEVVYTPGSSLRRPGVMIAQMFRDLVSSRELAWRLFVRDLRAKHRRSLLGYGWLLLTPVVTTLLFVFLHSQKILNIGKTDIPYPAYVLTGMLLWETFLAALGAPAEKVSSATRMLTKLNFPREALLLTSFYQILFNLGIKSLLLVAVFLWFGVSVPATIVLAPLGILALIAFGYSLGLLLVPLSVLYSDVGGAMGIVKKAWFLATPVVYPPLRAWPVCLATQLNPVAQLLITTRDLMTKGHVSNLSAFLAITAATLVLFFLGWVLFRLSMPHLVARMSA